MPNISVIVPIYNSEKAIAQCLNSILSQTYSDFELLLINDGSTDSCPQICNEYARKDNRIRVIHKLNQGVSAARNDGIAAAHGTYIAFVDSDDYVSNDFLSVLLEGTSDDFDLICATKTNIYGDRHLPEKKTAFELDLTQKIGSYYNKLADFTSPCMKLFKRSIIMDYNIRFNPAIHYGEDSAFLYEYLFYCKRIKQISDCVYFYRIYDGSAAHKFQKGISKCLAYRQTQFEAFIRKLQFVDPVNDIIIEGFACNGFRLLLNNVLQAEKNHAIEEIEKGYAVFGKHIMRLSERIRCGENVRVGGIPDSFHREIAFLAKTNQAERIYRFAVRRARKKKTIQKLKQIAKRVLRKT